MSEAVVSRNACGDCRSLLVFGCRCQLPRCRRGAVPDGEGCRREPREPLPDARDALRHTGVGA